MQNNVAVPFVDLQVPHNLLAQELNEAVQRVMTRSSFILGAEVETFEGEFGQLSASVSRLTTALGRISNS